MSSRMSYIAVAALVMLAGAAQAQPYPNKPIKAIVPYGAGQATDVMCRVFLEQMRVVLNQPIVVENRPGAGGNIGGAEAAKVDARRLHRPVHGQRDDRQQPVPVREHGLRSDEGHRSRQRRRGHGLRASRQQQAEGQVGGRDPGDGQGFAQADGRSVSPARPRTSSTGCSPMPPRSNSCACLTAPATGTCSPISCAATSTSSSRRCRRRWRRSPTDKSRRSRSPIRRALLSCPTSPTFKEGGLDLSLLGWNAFYVPRGTPPEIVAALNRAANEALKDAELKRRFGTVASEPIGGTPADLEAMNKMDRAKYEPMIKSLGLKPN